MLERWKLQTPAPETIEDKPLEPKAPWDKLLVDAASKRGADLVVSAALTCVAREIAAIVIEKGAFPPSNVRRFLAARCGAPSAQIAFNGFTRDTNGEDSDEKLFADVKPDLLRLVEEGLPQGRAGVGLWFGRVNNKTGAFLATLPRRVQIEAMPAVPASSKVVVRGKLFEPTAYVRGVATKGSFGFTECKADPTVVLPDFAVTCEVDKEDARVWVDIAAFAPGRIVGRTVVSALVFPAGKPEDEYTFRSGETETAVKPEALPGALLSRLNDLRGQAKLPALTLEQAESRTATELAPFFFAAAAGNVEETIADRVVLGVRAGWEVQGTVRFGDFASVIAPSTSSPAQIIDLALEQPSTRAAIFAPETSRLALGPIASTKEPLLGVLFATYAMLESKTHTQDAAAVIDKITQKRLARGLPPPAQLGGLEGISQKVSLAVSRGEKTPEEGLQEFLEQSVNTLGRGLKAWVFEGPTVELLEPPKELLEAPSLRFAVAVTHHKPANEPWARVVVYCVVDPNAKGDVGVASTGEWAPVF